SAEPAVDDGADFDTRQLDHASSVAESPYELPTQGEDPFTSVRHGGQSPVDEDLFAIETRSYDAGLSLGELEAVAEPSVDDWFAPSTVEITRSEHPTPAFTESFFPELGVTSKPSAELDPES